MMRIKGEGLVKYAIEGNIAEISNIFEKNKDNISNYEISQSLMYSVKRCNNDDISKFIIDKTYDINPKLLDSVIIWASCYGNLEIVKYLVEKGVDIHHRDDESIIEASRHGHLEVVKYLVENGADINANDNAALYMAYDEHLEIVKFLIEKGADTYMFSFKEKIKLGIPIIWSKKPAFLPSFREPIECPISNVKLTADVQKLGCSKCLNVFEQSALEEWFKSGGETCPICRNVSIEEFYLL